VCAVVVAGISVVDVCGVGDAVIAVVVIVVMIVDVIWIEVHGVGVHDVVAAGGDVSVVVCWLLCR